MAVLVCGGAGYIGSHMAAELLARGYDTVVLDNLALGHIKAVPAKARFYEGNIGDEEITEKIFIENEITAVVDFAAYAVVPESVANPLMYYENNVTSSLSLLKSMIKHGVKKIVFSSTASTYGVPERIPITEDMPQRPINPYGETKLVFEKIMKWFDAAYGLKYVALRYFNVAGARAGGKIGEDHEPETHLIPNILKTALKINAVFELMGNDYDTKDGTCVRDYIHVDDLADAHILSLEKLMRGENSAVYNLGSGTGFSNKEILDAAVRITGIDIPVKISPRRPGDPPVLIASSEKIKSELLWNPSRTNLESLIGTAWEWHRANPGGYGS